MEAQDLIYLVSCAVNGVKPEPERVAGMDLDAIYKLASRHLLAAAVAPALKAAGVKDARFANALEHAALKSSTMDMEMDALFAEMDAAGIWHMPLKGTVLQHLYPVYGMRQMSDHDILFDAKRAGDVKAIMEGLGFSAELYGTGNHDVYHKEPVSNFEMHRELFGQGHEEKLYAYYRNIEKRLLGDGYEKHFSPEDFYLYAIAHEYKHYSGDGTGLRFLLDIYVYLQKESLDMRYVISEAEKLGIADFEASGRSLAQHLFSGETLTEADKEMLDYILSSGVYGTLDHRVENRLQKYGGGKLRYALRRVAAPISKKNPEYYMVASKYPFFYKHKILLPLLPVWRVLYTLKSGWLKKELKVLKKVKM